jgi:LacI family transcriptional regulator
MRHPRIVVLLMSWMPSYERGILRGIAQYSRLHGPWVFVMPGVHRELPLPGNPDVDDALLPLPDITELSRRRVFPDLRKSAVTGLIGRIETPAVAKAVLESGLPAIAMDLSAEQLAADNPLARLSEIHPDSHQAGRLAAEHLLERGLRHFAFCGNPGQIWSDRREDGFRQRLDEAGFSCSVHRPSRVKSSLSSARERPRLLAWLWSLPKPVGLMASNDVRGLEIAEACSEAQILVPDEVAIVGVDEDRLLCDLANPTLSSVMLDTERAGYRAAELLDRMMSGKRTRRERIVVEALWVVTRRSTDVLAVEDRDVAEAMRFIRENAKRPIGVADVVRRLAVSRRALEIRFRRTLGRPIRAEIERVRLSKLKQLLVETDMPLWKLSEMAGFSSLSYTSQVFRREVGATMRSYRSNHRTP